MEPTYHLEGIIHSKEEMEDFEGPLNLILLLLSKNKIEIRDIRISEILDQYLEYLANMEAMDLEIASEFVQMASHLLYIKTKMLLSTQDEVSELELLIQSLEQLKARDVLGSIKEVTPLFASASALGSLYGVKPPEPVKRSKEYIYHHEKHELLRAILNVYTRTSPAAEESDHLTRKHVVPKKIIYNVRDKSLEIIRRFEKCHELPLGMLYGESSSRSEIVATFISVLELCSVGDIKMTASGGDIILSFSGKSVESAIDSIGE